MLDKYPRRGYSYKYVNQKERTRTMLRKRRIADMPKEERLNRIAGHVEGIRKMVDSNRYCVDIIIQIRAVKAALKALEYDLLEDHLKELAETAFSGKVVKKDKIEELKSLFDNFNN